MGLRNLLRRAAPQPVEDPRDIGTGTGTEDIYVMSLADLLRQLEEDNAWFIDPAFYPNFNEQEELLDDSE